MATEIAEAPVPPKAKVARAPKAVVATPEPTPAPVVTKKTPRVVEHVKVAEPVQVVTRKPKAQVVAPPETKPAPSGVHIETNQLVKSIGMIVLGGGILFAVWYLIPTEVITAALYLALPLLLIAVGLRLISSGTLQLVWNGELAERVDAYIKTLSSDKAKA
jgi:hypothetical protein